MNFEEGFKMITDNLYLCFCDMIEYRGYGWFSNNTYNGLYKMDLENGDITWVAKFESEEDRAILLHRKILRYEDYLFFFPERGKMISVYDVGLNRMESIALDPFYDIERKCNVNHVIMQDRENCIIFPQHIYQPLLKMNLKTKVIMKEDEWNHRIMKKFPSADLISDVCVHLGNVYCMLPNTHTILETVLHTLEVKEYFLDELDLCGSVFDWTKDRIWTVNMDCTKLMSFDLSGEKKEMIRLPEQLIQSRYNVNGILDTEYNVILLPGLAEEIIIYDKKTKSFSVIGDYPEGFRWKKISSMDKKRFPKFYGSVRKNGEIYLFPFLGTHILKLDLKHKRLTNVDISFCYTKRDGLGWKVLNDELKSGRIKEDEGDLKKYLDMVRQNNIGTDLFTEQQKFQNGKNIFEHTK